MRKLILVAVLIVAGAAVYAQTPDGETPANEGVCDELIGFTPGLYGLCVAYCEAQDCDLDAPLSAQCAAPNPSILANYNSRKQAGDPDMPCIQVPCPCFTSEDLAARSWSWCTEWLITAPQGPRIDLRAPTRRAFVREVSPIRPSSIDPLCRLNFSDHPRIFRVFDNITDEEASSCRALIEDMRDDLGLVCTVFE